MSHKITIATDNLNLVAPDLVTRRELSRLTRAISKMDDLDRRDHQDFDERVADEAVKLKEISVGLSFSSYKESLNVL